MIATHSNTVSFDSRTFVRMDATCSLVMRTALRDVDVAPAPVLALPTPSVVGAVLFGEGAPAASFVKYLHVHNASLQAQNKIKTV